jgi:hypothetical protein
VTGHAEDNRGNTGIHCLNTERLFSTAYEAYFAPSKQYQPEERCKADNEHS